MEKVSVTIRHGEQKQCAKLRRGLGPQALRSENELIEFDCRKADCGICIVSVLQGADKLSPPTAQEADFLKAMRAEPNERLACQFRIFGDVDLKVEEF